MLRIFKDRQVRRVLIATCFAMAFIWVAMRWFGVEKNVVYVFAVLAFVLTGVLILIGFVFSFVLHWFMRRESGMLGNIEAEEESLQDQAPQTKKEDAPQDENQSGGSSS